MGKQLLASISNVFGYGLCTALSGYILLYIYHFKLLGVWLSYLVGTTVLFIIGINILL